MVDRRLGLSVFKKMSQDEQTKLLTSIETALTYAIRRGVTVTDLEHEASEKLNVASSVIKIVSGSKRFKTKLGTRLL